MAAIHGNGGRRTDGRCISVRPLRREIDLARHGEGRGVRGGGGIGVGVVLSLLARLHRVAPAHQRVCETEAVRNVIDGSS